MTTTAKAIGPYLSLYDLEVRGTPASAGTVDAEASARCMAGRAHVAVRVLPDTAGPTDVDVATVVGSKTFADVAPGRSAYVAFPARSTQVGAGTVDVRVSDGRTAEITYAPLTC
ncbi:hypothetical protein [Cellulosimicrobium arenosum]|uniref:Uncharacterized protein n=1 Tax=Cellulosimicrobium arenosum TaxID=2708133 RepID=A0A927G7L5_9MICO|nr:hypothetical protein [Cellulosimicrobium arenosum]MBD8078377.1 hypothetical protein [Cellulosimicrobium arenosum]